MKIIVQSINHVALEYFKGVFKINLSDFLIIFGLFLLGTGLWLISPPIMFIVIGTVIFFIGFIGAKNTPQKEGDDG